jgi:hypothetical protein
MGLHCANSSSVRDCRYPTSSSHAVSAVPDLRVSTVLTCRQYADHAMDKEATCVDGQGSAKKSERGGKWRCADDARSFTSSVQDEPLPDSCQRAGVDLTQYSRPAVTTPSIRSLGGDTVAWADRIAAHHKRRVNLVLSSLRSQPASALNGRWHRGCGCELGELEAVREPHDRHEANG